MPAGWLDDIGLPQYKDQFHESRVDGRMLQYLTVVRVFSFNISLIPVSSQLRCPWGGYFKLDSTTSLTSLRSENHVVCHIRGARLPSPNHCAKKSCWCVHMHLLRCGWLVCVWSEKEPRRSFVTLETLVHQPKRSSSRMIYSS